jgi:hypothetical protein
MKSTIFITLASAAVVSAAPTPVHLMGRAPPNIPTASEVLKRDGSGVVTDSSCVSTSGSWFSPYDGATWSLASDVDIDHMVPLSNAWKVRFFPLSLSSLPGQFQC